MTWDVCHDLTVVYASCWFFFLSTPQRPVVAFKFTMTMIMVIIMVIILIIIIIRAELISHQFQVEVKSTCQSLTVFVQQAIWLVWECAREFFCTPLLPTIMLQLPCVLACFINPSWLKYLYIRQDLLNENLSAFMLYTSWPLKSQMHYFCNRWLPLSLSIGHSAQLFCRCSLIYQMEANLGALHPSRLSCVDYTDTVFHFLC